MTAEGSDDRLFLELTRALAPPSLAVDDARLALGLLALSSGALVVDLGCGYGRHLGALAAGGARVVGVDRSPLLVAEARRAGAGPLVRADLRALPFAAGALGGATCFYSSMFLGSDEDARAALAEAARVLAPGARLVLTTDNPLRLAASPAARFERDVPGVGRVREESRFAGGVDAIERSVLREGGAVEASSVRIRYYLPRALAALGAAAGLRLLRLEPDAPLDEGTPQLVALFER